MSDSGINEARFLRLFIKAEPDLRAYSRALLPTWDGVDDVIQNASVVMWKKFGQLETDDGFLPWAKVIVRFEALRARRNYARDRLVFDDELINLLAETADETEETTSLGSRRALKICLSKLRAKHRELVLAPYSSSTSVKDLAADSGVTPNAFYKLISRLRAKILTCVESEMIKESN